MNKKQHNKLMAEVMKQANKLKLMDLNSLPESITIAVKPTNKTKIQLLFSPMAWIKLNQLVKAYTTEVAWHGITQYIREKHVLYVSDILVYPQRVTGAYVESDDEHYGNWLGSLSDEQFDNNRLQGHSHVHMGTSPSGPDHAFYQTFMKTHAPEYYMFMISNKSGDAWFNFYDTVEGLLYETADIVVDVRFKDISCKDWVKSVEEYTKKFSYSAPKPATVVAPATTPQPNVGTLQDKQVAMDNIKAVNDALNRNNQPPIHQRVVDAYGNDISNRYAWAEGAGGHD
jgi:hypothetical protein